ncbi:MAG TPA: hypothetical protein VE398_15320, partial [Acidobacteriota bacterium]|nr:hypothetical protein [Acidobacteriota bacterium]
HYWLIALKNDTILAVTDYWLEGSVFHYMSREGKQYSIDYSQVDLDLTRQLNTERGLEFKPPRAKTSYQPRRYDAYGKPQMPDTRQLAPSPGAVPVSANLR